MTLAVLVSRGADPHASTSPGAAAARSRKPTMSGLRLNTQGVAYIRTRAGSSTFPAARLVRTIRGRRHVARRATLIPKTPRRATQRIASESNRADTVLSVVTSRVRVSKDHIQHRPANSARQSDTLALYCRPGIRLHDTVREGLDQAGLKAHASVPPAAAIRQSFRARVGNRHRDLLSHRFDVRFPRGLRIADRRAGTCGVIPWLLRRVDRPRGCQAAAQRKDKRRSGPPDEGRSHGHAP